MRIGDTVLSLPTLLIAILFNAICKELLPQAICVSSWHPEYLCCRSQP